MGVPGPLDDVRLDDLQQRFITAINAQPRLATTHAKLLTHALGLLNHALREHRQNRLSETPNSLPRSIKLWHILPALLHSQDGRVKRCEKLAPVKRGDPSIFLPWLTEFTRWASSRRSGPVHEATDEAKFKRASSPCRSPEGRTAAACSLLTEQHAHGNETTSRVEG